MVLPSFLIYLFVFGFPIILAIVLSLSNYGGGKMFGGAPWGITGFQQYLRLFTDPYFWNALKNNIYIVLISVFGQLPLGFIFAYLIYRKTVKFGEFWQGVLYIPAMISTIVVGILWSIIFSPYGPIADTANHYYCRRIFGKNLGNFPGHRRAFGPRCADRADHKGEPFDHKHGILGSFRRSQGFFAEL